MIFLQNKHTENRAENKISEFVDLLYENKNAMQQLSAMYHATLWITLYQETSQYNLHFSKEMLSKINELGIALDVTCMQLQEFYSETYSNGESHEV